MLHSHTDAFKVIGKEKKNLEDETSKVFFFSNLIINSSSVYIHLLSVSLVKVDDSYLIPIKYFFYRRYESHTNLLQARKNCT